MSRDDIHKALCADFTADELDWKVQTCGKGGNDGIWALVVPYVSNRAIQARLDEMVKGADGGVIGILCGLSIFDPTYNEWVEKIDGAEPTDIESFKGGLSNAMKRAAVQWGMGRYLYNLEKCWAHVHADGKHFAKTKDGVGFNWDPPALPTFLAKPTSVGVPKDPTPPAGQPIIAAPAPTPAPSTPAAAAPSPAQRTIAKAPQNLPPQEEAQPPMDHKAMCSAVYLNLLKAADKPIAEAIWKAGETYEEKLPLLEQALADLCHIKGCAGQHAFDMVRAIADQHGFTMVATKGAKGFTNRGDIPKENLLAFLDDLTACANGEVTAGSERDQ